MFLQGLLAIILSAIGVSLAQPSELILKGNCLLGLIAWAPLFLAIRQAPTCGQASLLISLFGGLTIILQNYWLAFFRNYGLITIGSTTLAFIGIYSLAGPFLWAFLRYHKPCRIFLVGAFWAVFEFLRSNGFLGFPWGLAPHPFHEWTWMTQIVDITGLSLLSFLIISWNAWLSELLERDKPMTPLTNLPDHRPSQKIPWTKTLAFFTAMIALLVTYGAYRLNESRPIRGYANMVLTQSNSDPWEKREDRSISASIQLSQEGLTKENIDLVVWSEGGLRYPFNQSQDYYRHFPPQLPLITAIQNSGTYWLLGSPHSIEVDQRNLFMNASILVDPQGQLVDYYGKNQLVPMAEYIPYWDLPIVQSFFRSLNLSSYSKGHKITIYTIPVKNNQPLSFATPICFEDAFPPITRQMVLNGAEVLVNITNDSWSKRDSSQWQHYVVSSFRSIENRVPLVRATTSGISCVIGTHGSLLEGPLPSFREAQLTVAVPLYKERKVTFYTRYGDWLIVLFMIVLIVNLLIRTYQLSKKPESS